MPDVVEKVKTQRGLFERIVHYIPGYRGYKEKEIRRESDRLVRQQAAASLKKALDLYKRSLSAGADLPESKRLAADRVLSRLDLLKERVAKAEGGYSGLFDAVKVREDRLDQMISVDHDLVSLCSELAGKVEKMAQSGALSATWSQNLVDVEAVIGRVEEALQKRDAVISQP
ncbi:MAG: hypothetical protein HYU39_08455 [Thaumarchaeota archaeon]|nr:hypothetical protein [Nitrososphaerota archaeon]